MKSFSGISLLAMSLLYSVTCSAAEPLKEPMLSFQGFTGILNTPNAHVSNEGSIHLVYTDQRESIWRGDQKKRQENYLFSVGVFSFLEINGRLVDAPMTNSAIGIRDLSASIKATSAPLTKDRPYWPVVALGFQDVGGGANQLQSRYVVLSEDFWRLRLSAGYGFSSERMKGGFGGVEFQAHDWVTLLGEYDTRDTSVGVRLLSPEIWKTPIRLSATFKSALNHEPGNIDIAAGLTFPLDFRKTSARESEQAAGSLQATDKNVEARKTSTLLSSFNSKDSAPVVAVQSSKQVVQEPDDNGSTNVVTPEKSAIMLNLQQKLVEAGFINVRVGQRISRELVVEYENTIYNHNELDALGVVAGIVSEQPLESFETVRMVVKRKGIRMAVVSAPVADVCDFLSQSKQTSRNLKNSLTFSYDTVILEDAYYLPESETFSFPNTSLILAPGLQTFVGTEVGVFDYVLSFRPEIISNLWKGGVFQARWDIPLMWSDNFDDGKPFRGTRRDARMDRAMLFQGVKLSPGLMANLGAGLVLHNTYGTLNEITWSPGEGTHRLRGVQSWARDPDARRSMDVFLGSYRYFYAPLDVSMEATAGKFWGQDSGFSFELKRFFADTAVSAYYKNTKTVESKHWQAVGVQFAFPLTSRKDLKVGPLQVRGADEWAYSQETTLAIGGQKTNDVMTQALAVNPQPSPNLSRSYYNRDRLGAEYIVRHIERLREAWLKYRTDSLKK